MSDKKYDTQLKISYLTVTQLSTITGRILEIVNASPEPGKYLLIKSLSESLTAEHKELSEALNVKKSSEFTSKLKELDDIRDDAFIAMRDQIESSTKRRKKPELQAAAIKIHELFEKHGNTLYSLGYADQTGKMHQFEADLATPEMQEAIDKSKTRELYEEMLESQKDFEELYQGKLETENDGDKPKRAFVIPALKFHLMLLIKNIIFLAEPDGSPFAETRRLIGEAVDDIMTIAKARKTRADGEVAKQ